MKKRETVSADSVKSGETSSSENSTGSYAYEQSGPSYDVRNCQKGTDKEEVLEKHEENAFNYYHHAPVKTEQDASSSFSYGYQKPPANEQQPNPFPMLSSDRFQMYGKNISSSTENPTNSSAACTASSTSHSHSGVSSSVRKMNPLVSQYTSYPSNKQYPSTRYPYQQKSHYPTTSPPPLPTSPRTPAFPVQSVFFPNQQKQQLPLNLPSMQQLIAAQTGNGTSGSSSSSSISVSCPPNILSSSSKLCPPESKPMSVGNNNYTQLHKIVPPPQSRSVNTNSNPPPSPPQHRSQYFDYYHYPQSQHQHPTQHPYQYVIHHQQHGGAARCTSLEGRHASPGSFHHPQQLPYNASSMSQHYLGGRQRYPNGTHSPSSTTSLPPPSPHQFNQANTPRIPVQLRRASSQTSTSYNPPHHFNSVAGSHANPYSTATDVSTSRSTSNYGTSECSSCPIKDSNNQSAAIHEERKDNKASPTAVIANNKRRERWTEDEHCLFLQGLEKYGRKWKKIQTFVQTKTAVQVRTHAYGYFAKLLRNMPEEESIWEVAQIMSSLPRTVLKGPGRSSGGNSANKKHRSEPRTDAKGMAILRKYVFTRQSHPNLHPPPQYPSSEKEADEKRKAVVQTLDSAVKQQQQPKVASATLRLQHHQPTSPELKQMPRSETSDSVSEKESATLSHHRKRNRDDEDEEAENILDGKKARIVSPENSVPPSNVVQKLLTAPTTVKPVNCQGKDNMGDEEIGTASIQSALNDGLLKAKLSSSTTA